MISIILALAASAVSPAQSANSDSTTEQIALHIDFGDLDLRTPAGQAEFMRRVRYAGSRACDLDPGPKTQSAWRKVFACKERARIQAAQAIERATGAVAVASNVRPDPEL